MVQFLTYENLHEFVFSARIKEMCFISKINWLPVIINYLSAPAYCIDIKHCIEMPQRVLSPWNSVLNLEDKRWNGHINSCIYLKNNILPDRTESNINVLLIVKLVTVHSYTRKCACIYPYVKEVHTMHYYCQ